mgnify:FL=1
MPDLYRLTWPLVRRLQPETAHNLALWGLGNRLVSGRPYDDPILETTLWGRRFRNPVGLAINPTSGEVWTAVNERDELGNNLVPDYVTSVKDGAFYGWPWSYYGQHVDPRVHPPRPDMVEKAIPPDYALSSHVAALGLTFSYGSALPEKYTNGAFIGEHGSWNRDTFNGYGVVYVPFEGGEPAGMAEMVVSGFLDGDQARGRPVGVTIDGTGALLVADDAGNTVWRVAAADGSVTDGPRGSDQIGGAGPVAEEAPAGGDGASDAEAPGGDASEGGGEEAGAEEASGEGDAAAEEGSDADAPPANTEVAPAVQPEAGDAEEE